MNEDYQNEWISPKPLGSTNFYRDVIYRVHNSLTQLTIPLNTNQNRIPGSPTRDVNLSDHKVNNLELSPVVIDTIDSQLSPSIYISLDSSDSANNEGGVFGDFVEFLFIRIELFVGCDNDNYRLTETSSDLIQDFHYVLNPLNFIGSSFAGRPENKIDILDGVTISSTLTPSNTLDTHRDPLDLIISLEKAELLNPSTPGYIKIEGTNIGNTNFSDYIFFDQESLGNLKITSNKFKSIGNITTEGFQSGEITIEAPITKRLKPAQIRNAQIVGWGYDERTRGTSNEILVFTFEVELHHDIQNKGPRRVITS